MTDDIESPDFIRGWNAAMEAKGLEVIDPWQPPPKAERPYWFKCLALADRWVIVAWNGSVWWCQEKNSRVTPTKFYPLPPAP